MPLDLSSALFEHAPTPMAAVDGATHIVRSANTAFCRLIDKSRDEILGTSFCELLPGESEFLSLLDLVYHTGKAASRAERRPGDQGDVFSSFEMWPVMADDRTVGIVVQLVESQPIHALTRAMNEALLLGSLRQHELAEASNSSNVQLKTEIDERKQRERDALILTNEISHRIKNNLQIVIALIANEIKRTPAPFVQGFVAMQARIGAIAKLYDLISQSSRGRTLPLDTYLRELATIMSESLLGKASGIRLVVKAEALEIDADRAVPFGLLVNELGTNAIKHAFPGGTGRVTLSVEQVGDQIELTIADNGVGMRHEDPAKAPGKHGSDYVAVFVRQLGGTIARSGSEGAGTTFRIRLPLLVTHPAWIERGAA